MRDEFGCKVSVATTLGEGFVVSIGSFQGNPYDGHTPHWRHRHGRDRPSRGQHPPEALLNATDLNKYNLTDIALGGPTVVDGRMAATDCPGLGTEPDAGSLGAPIALFGIE